MQSVLLSHVLVSPNFHLCQTDKPVHFPSEDDDKAPYKMIQTIGLSVGAAVAYIIVVLGLMFYCKKRRNAQRMQKGQDGEEPEMECLNGMIADKVMVVQLHNNPVCYFKIFAATLCSFY